MDFFEFGYFGLFLASFLASTIIPFSSEALLSAMIYYNYNTILCVAVATFGNTLGGITSYFLGYLGKWSLLEKYMGVKLEKIEKFHTKIKRKGSIIALFTWLPIVGDLISVSLGFMRVDFKVVLLYTFVGKLFRYIVIVYFTNLMF
jgi:membrane protein YqaA with SNARE-associated domain